MTNCTHIARQARQSFDFPTQDLPRLPRGPLSVAGADYRERFVDCDTSQIHHLAITTVVQWSGFFLPRIRPVNKLYSCMWQVLIVLSALSTVDPGDIMASVKAAATQRTRVSVVGVAAQVHICETLTKVLACHHILCIT